MFQDKYAQPLRSGVVAVVFLAALICLAGGVSACPPVRLGKPFLVTQLPVDRIAEARLAAAGGMLRASCGDGARVVLVNVDGTTCNLTAGFHSACDADVSFDATRVLFAGKRSATDVWNIYEMAIDGSQVRQITRDLGDCRSPSYQSTYYEISEESPWPQITFVRIDPSTQNECGGDPVSSVYSCKLDGTRVRRLTYNLSSYQEQADGEAQAKKVVTGGSFNVEVPANTPIQLQLLDENSVALRSCGWIWVRNHQAQGCIGCHEDGELTPTNWQVSALWENSAKACPPPEQRISVDFRREVFPILAKRCTGCHDKKGSAPILAADAGSPGSPASEASARFAYEALLASDKSGTETNPFGKYVHPGRARTSPLVWHLLGRNLSRPWDGAAVHQAAKPIPPDRPNPLSAEEQQLFVKWVDLGAPWEHVPAEAAASAGHDAGKQTER